VSGIVHLVASSVEGLKPENVTVVDTDGTVLSQDIALNGGQGNTTQLTQTQMAMKANYEKSLQSSIQSMLERILGPGKAVVRVNAELNFDQKASTKEIYGPNSFVRSERIIEESTTSSEANPEGVPGTETNIPSYQQANNAGNTSSSDKSDKTRNYEIDKEVLAQTFAQGNVKRLTVSVIVDRDLNNQQERDQILEAIKNASGYSENRGVDQNGNVISDSVSVVGMKFTPAPEEPAPSTVLTILNRYGLPLGILAVVIIGLAVFLATRRKQSVVEEESVFDALVDEELKIEDLLERELSPDEKEKRKIREEIEKFVDNSPEDAASLLRTWLLEDGR
jgi:flagellar M-ring protein FliF